jgi:hypothetical protein
MTEQPLEKKTVGALGRQMAWKNQTEITVAGRHFVQEDSGPDIGRAVADWIKESGL